jgi:acetyltransferase
MGGLKGMFDPSTVAIVGATEKEGSVGRAVLENMLLAEGRRIFPVNPSRQSVLGIPCFKKVTDIPEPPDLAIIVTPAAMVPDAVEQCGRAGVQGAVVISAGFRETGDEGRKLEDRIEEIRTKYGTRLLGPNCLGFIRPGIRLNATFVKTMPEPGKIAFISHSGALGSTIIDWVMDAGVGLSMFASLGSMLDIDFGDLIDYLGDDPKTKSIMIFMEDVRHAKKFMSAARGFARVKPIIVLKPGKYKEGTGAAVSLTGAMIGDDQVYDAAFKRVGVVRVDSISDLVNCAGVLDSRHLPAGARLAVITNAGAPGVITADWLIAQGGRLATLSAETTSRLDSVLPGVRSRENPVNVLGDADIDRYTSALTICLDDPGVDGVLLIYAPQWPAISGVLAEAVSTVADQAQKPVITTFMGARSVAAGRDILAHHRIPTYDTPEEAVRTYLYMNKYQRSLELLYETPVELPVDQAPPKNSLKALIRSISREGRKVLTEEESKRFLAAYKIPCTPVRIASSADAAAAIAEQIGYPVILKIVSPDIPHRLDAGGIAPGIQSKKDVRDRYDGMMARIGEYAPHAAVHGVNVQRMVGEVDYQLILGAKKHKDFGAVILFGMAGATALVLKDFSVALPPLNQTLARRLMEETRVYSAMVGNKSPRVINLLRLEQIVVSFANLITDFPEIGEMDINPLALVRGDPLALDARIVIDPGRLDYYAPYPHLVIAPYPTKYITPYTLSGGRQALLRPIRPEDEPLEREMLASLSPETVRGRFFQSIKNLSHAELTRFCNIDYEREMAFVVELAEGGVRKMVGVGRLIIESDFKAGEFAVLVQDGYQNKGLGRKLLDMVIGVAQEKHVEMLYGIVLSDNYRMLDICRQTGFTLERLEDGLTRVELILT